MSQPQTNLPQGTFAMAEFNVPIIDGNRAALVSVIEGAYGTAVLDQQVRDDLVAAFEKALGDGNESDSILPFPGGNLEHLKFQPTPKISFFSTKSGALAVCFEIEDTSSHKRTAAEMEKLLFEAHGRLQYTLCGGDWGADMRKQGGAHPAVSNARFTDCLRQMMGRQFAYERWVNFEQVPATLKAEVVNHFKAEQRAHLRIV